MQTVSADELAQAVDEVRAQQYSLGERFFSVYVKQLRALQEAVAQFAAADVLPPTGSAQNPFWNKQELLRRLGEIEALLQLINVKSPEATRPGEVVELLEKIAPLHLEAKAVAADLQKTLADIDRLAADQAISHRMRLAEQIRTTTYEIVKYAIHLKERKDLLQGSPLQMARISLVSQEDFLLHYSQGDQEVIPERRNNALNADDQLRRYLLYWSLFSFYVSEEVTENYVEQPEQYDAAQTGINESRTNHKYVDAFYVQSINDHRRKKDPSLSGPHTVLDIGCGTGNRSFRLSQGIGGAVIGMDFDRRLVEFAQRKYVNPGLSFKACNMITFVDEGVATEGAADALTCMNGTLGFVNAAARRATMSQFYRALKPEGLLLIDVFNASLQGELRSVVLANRLIRSLMSTNEHVKDILRIVEEGDIIYLKTTEIEEIQMQHYEEKLKHLGDGALRKIFLDRPFRKPSQMHYFTPDEFATLGREAGFTLSGMYSTRQSPGAAPQELSDPGRYGTLIAVFRK